MDAIEALVSRSSAARLTEPAPTDEAIGQMLAAAARAPDHGRLRPWRFLIIRGPARERLGGLLADSLLRRDPNAAEVQLARERAKPTRAPLIIVVAAAIQPDHPKIPEIEQVLAAGCAAQNIMLAAHAMGYGAMWKTGAPAYDPVVKAALGLEAHDAIIGFMYVGSLEGSAEAAPAPDPRDFARDWSGTG